MHLKRRLDFIFLSGNLPLMIQTSFILPSIFFVLSTTSLTFSHAQLAKHSELESWYESTSIPGEFNVSAPEEAKKVYRELNRFLYDGGGLSPEEVAQIPSHLKQSALEAVKTALQQNDTCTPHHHVEFFDDNSLLKLPASKALKGFEKGLVRIESVGCIKTNNFPEAHSRAALALWDPEFRKKAIPDIKQAWLTLDNPQQLCERMELKVGPFNLGTSIYCMESQLHHSDNAAYMQIWSVANGSRRDGMTLPIFYNQLVGVFQKIPSGLHVTINGYIRGFGSSGAPKSQMRSLLMKQQESLWKSLEQHLKNTQQ